MDVDEMEAGRELDKLIAEKVLGLKVEAGYHGEQIIFVGKHKSVRLASYSTRIAAAWQVVEAFNDGHDGHVMSVVEVIVTDLLPAEVVCEIYGPDRAKVKAIGRTAPLAICRAALKAVGDAR